MSLQLVVRGEQKALEGRPGVRLIEFEEDVGDVIGECFEHKVGSVLLYADNLTERFFDLSSGEAGAILQKFRNYRIRVAVVVSPGGAQQSDRFREMVAEERKGDDFRVFDDREAALGWLIGSSVRSPAD